MSQDKLLEARKQSKLRKPTFKRVQSNQFPKLRNQGNTWRKPKGMGNKVRRQRRGQPKMPTVGYGAPKQIRGLNRLGLNEIIVSNVSDLSKITKTDTVVISSTVGAKKKITILEEVKKAKLNISYIYDIDAKIKELTKVKKVKTNKKSETKVEPKQETKVEQTKKVEDKKEEIKK